MRLTDFDPSGAGSTTKIALGARYKHHLIYFKLIGISTAVAKLSQTPVHGFCDIRLREKRDAGSRCDRYSQFLALSREVDHGVTKAKSYFVVLKITL